MGAGYFDPASELKPLIHAWSLAIEEQYYLLFPFIALFLFRFGYKFLALFVFILLSVGIVLSEYAAGASSAAAYYLMPYRAWELLAGAMVAVSYPWWSPFNKVRWLSQPAAFLGFLLVMLPVFLYDSHTKFPGYSASIPVIGASLLIVFATASTLVGRFLSCKVMVSVGLISYSLYLWHQPILSLARERSLDGLSRIDLILCLVMVLAMSYLTWKYVETPFRKKGLIGRPRLAIFVVGGGGLLIAFGVAGYFSSGFPGRYDDATYFLMSASNDRNPRQQECNTGGVGYRNPSEACVLGSKDNVVAVLLGDSHADSIAHPLSIEMERRGIGAKQMTYGGCPPVREVFRRGDFRCADYYHEVLKVIQDPSIKTVVLMARWSIYSEGQAFDNGEGGVEHGVDGIWVDVGVAEVDRSRSLPVRKKAIVDAFAGEVLELLSSGKRVVIVYPVPEVGWSVPEYAAKKFARTGDASVSTSYQVYLDRNLDVIMAFDGIGEREGLFRVRPHSKLCDSIVPGRCVAAVGGDVFYFDDDHLSNRGAWTFVGEIVDALE